jgi:hypothetical protein
MPEKITAAPELAEMIDDVEDAIVLLERVLLCDLELNHNGVAAYPYYE